MLQKGEPMDDLISRQAAIEAIDTYIDKFDAIDANFLDGLKTANKLMMQLPPAQLARIADGGKNDCVSRQAVIEMLNETKRIARQNIDGAVLMTFERVLDSLVNITNALPTIQPKRGKWIIKDDTERFIAQCNCCRYIEDSRRIKNFCPNCGADMREVTE